MMKPTLTRPVTIHSVRHGERWFPFMFRHTDGTLLLYIGYGHDRDLVPGFRLRSVDGGRTWIEESAHVPRPFWVRSFDDGELFEIDGYGVQDPKAKDHYVHIGAWSFPSDPRRAVLRGHVRIHAPSANPQTLNALFATSGYPTYPWWPLFNFLHGKKEVGGNEVMIGGPYFTSGVSLSDGRLITLGYLRNPQGKGWSSYCFESRDRGHNWNEVACVARGHADADTEGFNEAALIQLRDRRLYAVVRGGPGGVLHQLWSGDVGRSWSTPKPLSALPDGHQPKMAWPTLCTLHDGTLVVGYGRPGKHLLLDPTGTGENWQSHVDLHEWELQTQALMGVPEEQRLHGPTHLGVRYWDSSDYLSVVVNGPRQLLVVYDVQGYVEHWNAHPISAIRMVRVTLA